MKHPSEIGGEKRARGKGQHPGVVLEEMAWTPEDLATFMRVKPATVYSWIHRKVDMPPSSKIGGTIRFRRSAVMEWIESDELDRKKRNFEA